MGSTPPKGPKCSMAVGSIWRILSGASHLLATNRNGSEALVNASNIFGMKSVGDDQKGEQW